MMISYEILGKVTARREGQSLAIPPQQQLLLARLVCAKGTPVPQAKLARDVWDGTAPDGGLKSAIYKLREALMDEKILVHDGAAYRLELKGDQVDAFRFATKLEQAAQRGGQQGLAQEALKEWGPHAAGLYGGLPLLGLEGSWARRVRRDLRVQYRNVVVGSLQRDAAAENWESMLLHCIQLVAEDQEDPDRKDPQEAMADTDFLELWLLAARESGRPDIARQVLTRAKEADARSGRRVADDLARRAQRPRDEKRSDRRAMNEPTINFNNNAGSVVKGQIGINHGGVTFSLAPETGEDSHPETGAAGESADENVDV